MCLGIQKDGLSSGSGTFFVKDGLTLITRYTFLKHKISNPLSFKPVHYLKKEHLIHTWSLHKYYTIIPQLAISGVGSHSMANRNCSSNSDSNVILAVIVMAAKTSTSSDSSAGTRCC